MPLKVLFAAHTDRWAEYEAPLNAAFEEAELKVDLARDHVPEVVDYIVYAPNGDLQDFSPFKSTKAVLSLWAGVESIVGNETLTQPLTRMVDSGLERGMVEWVTGHVLRHHLGIDQDVLGQNGAWRPHVPPLACERPVTILGLGELGKACGLALAQLGFPVIGWSRSEKKIQGINCIFGEENLATALQSASIIVLLLPLTSNTENLMNADRLAQLPKGAVVINPGRGQLVNDDALLQSLDSGHLSHATLDVFRIEPLPSEHPFWAHPKVTVTPHIASETRPTTAAKVIADNITRGEAGEPFLFLVNRKLGY
ncbi:MAG: glyoxylate/hydroxypyruvate reductase A [Pseudomonadota bacterium]